MSTTNNNPITDYFDYQCEQTIINRTSINEKEWEELTPFIYHYFKKNTAVFKFNFAYHGNNDNGDHVIYTNFYAGSTGIGSILHYLSQDDGYKLNFINIKPYSRKRLIYSIQLMRKNEEEA